MTYRWEPTTPLDRILETGFKRMDEAVEGVIERLVPDHYSQYINECMADMLDAEDERVMADMAKRQYEGLLRQRAGVGGVGLHGIGDQSAFGSPLNLLGAAYCNAFGGGL